MEYKLNIVNGFIGVFLFPIYILIILFSFLLSTHLDNSLFKWVVVLGTIILVGVFFFRIVAGKLLAIVDNENLTFKWIRRPLFSASKVKSIPVNEINRIIIDQDQIVRKIYYKNEKICLNTWKPDSFYKDDNGEFLKFLRSIEKKNKNVSILDSWDVWYEKGYLKVVYWINTSILIVGGFLIAYSLFRKGFNPIHLIYLVFAIIQLLIHHVTIKAKMQKN